MSAVDLENPFDVADAEDAVCAALNGSGDDALEACLRQMSSTSAAAARSSVTYNVWSEWLTVNQD